MGLWLDVGCKTDGSNSPSLDRHDQLDWWNTMTVAEVREDMEAKYLLAVLGNENYPDQCFGPGERFGGGGLYQPCAQ